jgi:hypothetical protein
MKNRSTDRNIELNKRKKIGDIESREEELVNNQYFSIKMVMP